MKIDPALSEQLNVSRETLNKLSSYVALVEKWQPRINLIAKSTLPDIWSRHVLDSAQLAAHLPPKTERILDVGSGGGFPGIILAILTDAEIHLVESDHRKSVFLKTVIRELGLNAIVHNKRVEAMATINADVITARALASVEKLLDLLKIQLTSAPLCLFLKGARVDEELTILKTYSNIEMKCFPSLTNADGVVLALKCNV